MSPAPDMMDEDIILNPLPNTTVLNGISSSDELDHNQYNEQRMDLGLVFFIIEFLFFSIR
jgi:hypothetical protein